MATWANSGSYQDLSGLAEDSMWVTSQAGGNMQSSSRQAMTAPGSQPVDPVRDRSQQGDPTVQLGAEIPVSTSGKPQAAGETSYTPGPVRWGPTTMPRVVRSAPANLPTAEVK